MSELRTCPFCGVKPHEIAKANVNGMPGHEYIHRVVCSICSCRDDDILIQFVGTGPDSAVAADVARKEWNRRPLEEALEARVKELEMDVAELKYLDGEGEIGAQAMMDENKWLKAELAQAKAAAVQWITYGGTPETLPANNGEAVLYAGEDGTIVVYLWKDQEWWHIEMGEGGFDVSPGDRWAYLPQPPAGVAI